MYTPFWQFGPKCATKIINWMQATYPAYEKFAAARSFFYRALDRHKKRLTTPDKDPHRDKRGENRVCTKRHDATIINLCDELLSEDKATAPKVRNGLRRNGFTLSLSTIYRIAKDLCFRWQKPWHTDILTPAQKYKRKLFCAELLRLPEHVLLQRIQRWMYSDEKWWDIVGPACYKYVKAGTAFEAKMQNQVCQNALAGKCLFFFFIPSHLLFFSDSSQQKQKGWHAKASLFLGGHLLVRQV